MKRTLSTEVDTSILILILSSLITALHLILFVAIMWVVKYFLSSIYFPFTREFQSIFCRIVFPLYVHLSHMNNTHYNYSILVIFDDLS